MKALSFFKSADVFVETVKRFPLAALCSLITFVLAVLAIENSYLFEKETHGRLIGLFVSGFFWFGAVQIFRESDQLRAPVFYGLALLGFSVLAAIWIMSGILEIQAPMLVGALLLLISSAPYFLQNNSNQSFWVFNFTVVIGAFIAFLGALILWGGASAALASIGYLFGIRIDDEIYFYIWCFSAILLAPTYALSWVPKNFSSENFASNRGFEFILNWILAPLVIVYMTILYAYFIKIAVTGDVPQGQLAYMITGFGTAGVVTCLAGYPFREKGQGLLRFTLKWFFPALIIPVLMQVYAIALRIEEYGLTEKRYLIVIAALWFGALALLYSFKKDAPLKIIPALLAAFLILASFGPWSAYNLSGWSQARIAEKLLIKNEILKNGRIVKTEKEISLDDRARISSVIEYLHQTERWDVLERWADKPEDGWEKYQADKYVGRMGIDFINSWQRQNAETENPEIFNLRSHKTPDAYEISGYNLMLNNVWTGLNDREDWERIWPDYNLRVIFNKEGVLTFVRDAQRVSFDLKKYALEKREQKIIDLDEMIMEESGQGMRVKLSLLYLDGRYEEEELLIQSFSFNAYLDFQN